MCILSQLVPWYGTWGIAGFDDPTDIVTSHIKPGIKDSTWKLCHLVDTTVHVSSNLISETSVYPNVHESEPVAANILEGLAVGSERYIHCLSYIFF